MLSTRKTSDLSSDSSLLGVHPTGVPNMLRLLARFLLLFVAAVAIACTDAPTVAAPELTPGEELTLTQASSDIYWSRGCPNIGPMAAIWKKTH